jgi:hypothetical protein
MNIEEDFLYRYFKENQQSFNETENNDIKGGSANQPEYDISDMIEQVQDIGIDNEDIQSPYLIYQKDESNIQGGNQSIKICLFKDKVRVLIDNIII